MIGELLCQYRTRHNLSQAEVARKLGVSLKSVSNWETDVSQPSIKHLKDLCNLYHVSADELLELKPVKTLNVEYLSQRDCKILNGLIQVIQDIDKIK